MKPEAVLHNWNVPELANLDNSNIKRSSSGLLNKTYLIRTQGKLFVLQCVHPAVSMDGSMNNYFHVTQFLREHGMQTQTVLPTTKNKLWVEGDEEDGTLLGPEGNSWRWRLLFGVEGNSFETTKDPALAEQAGKILGQTLVLLKDYPKPLEPGRKAFQYLGEIEKLSQYQEQFAADDDEQIREAANLLRTELPKLLLPDDLPKRIIHGDPKVSNFLFTNDGKGIGMIDFDTIQLISPLYELGDALRSWCGQKEDDPNNTFNTEIYDAFLRGYLDTSKSLLSEQEQSLIPQACKLIMLGLATRFMNDYIDDSYFGWDETRYQSRKDHNKARALGQISLYRSYIKLT